MQNSQLKRVINLLKRTGDKTVIMDNESDAVMMLMDLGAYEKMLGRCDMVEKLTEEELMEKINRDVALWRAHNDKEKTEIYDEALDNKAVTPARSAPVPVKEPEKAVFMENRNEIKIEQAQSASDIVAEEEEKFYLEPVE
jgi:hypothetical protein